MTYKELKELLIRASDAYYINNNPIMTDFEFDSKLKELEMMEQSQGFADPDSPTRAPGSDITEINMSNKHGRAMLSLENTYNSEEVIKWFEDMQKATGEANPEIVVNPKWDGGSGALRYSNGRLIKALTRGNGEVGEDITQNTQYCDENIWAPKTSRMGMTVLPFSGEARGELIMTSAGFEELNKNGQYQNARNLLSGSLKLLDVYEFIPRASAIKFYAYWLEDSANTRYSDDLEELKRFGFSIGPYYICKTVDELITAINNIESTKLDCALDGAVMKLNNKKFWGIIGSTAKAPRWAKAYKYKQASLETVVKEITFEVGRSGKITPLCWFEPIFLDGSTVQKATLNNEDFYRNMDVAIGDTIEVQKAAAIIPQIISVNERPDDRVIVEFPTHCPICGSKLGKRDITHADYYCNNPKCQARVIDTIVNYTSSLEIDGFAEIIVEKLYNAGLLKSVVDLYRLKDHIPEIASLDRLSEKIANKLITNIENSKTAELWRMISALGIPNVGPKTAKTLAKKFGSIEGLRNSTIAQLTDIEDIGEIVAKSITEFFSNESNLIDSLVLLGAIGNNTVDAPSTGTLEGQTFCITGALSHPRAEFVKAIEGLGGKVVDSVSRKTTFLITNDPNSGSSKNKKARELGIPILTESELIEKYNLKV